MCLCFGFGVFEKGSQHSQDWPPIHDVAEDDHRILAFSGCSIQNLLSVSFLLATQTTVKSHHSLQPSEYLFICSIFPLYRDQQHGAQSLFSGVLTGLTTAWDPEVSDIGGAM